MKKEQYFCLDCFENDFENLSNNRLECKNCGAVFDRQELEQRLLKERIKYGLSVDE